MRKLLLATTCLTLVATASMAADLPIATKAPVYSSPAFSWTGFYVGAQVGGGTLSDPSTLYEGYGSSTGGKGALAGGQVGYNYQDGNWVFGIEGEGYWSGIKDSQDYNYLNSTTGAVTELYNSTASNRYDYTIAGRVGLAFDRTLVFAKGGWAWGNYKYNFSETAPGSSDGNSQYGTVTLDGALFGVGLEHALTRNWTIKFEYDYIAYGSKLLSTRFSSTSGGVTTSGYGDGSPFSSTKQVFKFGANYLFDPWGAPLLAKY